MLQNKKLVLLIGLLMIFTLALAACTPAAPATEAMTEEMTAEPTEEMTAEPTEEMTAEPTEEMVAYGTEENPFIFSFVPSNDAATVLTSASAITDALSESTGLVINATVPTSFVAAIEAMCAGEAQAGALNTFSYVVAHERGCADVALASSRFGSTTYTGQIITRADSGIETVEDLAGHSFCRPDEFSTSGWIIPSITMRAAGVDPDTDLTEVIDAGGHSGVVRSVYNGDCDAGATFVDARTNIAEESPDVNEVVVVIAVSEAIPNDTIAFSPEVPQEQQAAIVDAFLAMTQDEAQMAMLTDLYSWGGLEKVDDSFYDPFRQLLEAAGVNVEDFVGN